MSTPPACPTRPPICRLLGGLTACPGRYHVPWCKIYAGSTFAANSTFSARSTFAARSSDCGILQAGQAIRQSWALAVFFKYFHSRKVIDIFSFSIKLIWLGVGFLNSIGLTLKWVAGNGRFQRNGYILYIKKNRRKYLKCPALLFTQWQCDQDWPWAYTYSIYIEPRHKNGAFLEIQISLSSVTDEAKQGKCHPDFSCKNVAGDIV